MFVAPGIQILLKLFNLRLRLILTVYVKTLRNFHEDIFHRYLCTGKSFRPEIGDKRVLLQFSVCLLVPYLLW